MKWMIASDIHGSATYCKLLFERFEAEAADRLILLGDLLYHGPRNDLPDGYAPKEVLAMLNEHKDRLFTVRGNCDGEVDQMVLDFPILADYALLPIGNNLIYITHGHHENEQNPPALRNGDILLCGHTHVPKCANHGNFTYINPGSVSIPKEESPRSYMIFDGETFIWKELENGDEYMKYSIPSTLN